jgi:ribonucleoside-diphosphate reductase alpha chain
VDVQSIAEAAGEECTADTVINICSSKVIDHPHYGELAMRMFVAKLQATAPSSFSEAVALLGGNMSPIFSGTVRTHAAELDAAIRPERDLLLGYFGVRTLEKGYLLRVGGRIVETPQYMFMRVAVAIHGGDVERAIETYDLMSTKRFIHATPTLFNSGTVSQQLSSCFLMNMKGDSIDGIFNTLKDCANVSKYAGGLGVSTSTVRAKGAFITGTMGTSNGLVPMLRVFNETARYVNQGNKRKGSIAIYMEPWHGDVLDFLALRKNYGAEDMRCRDLFTAMWVPDLFMRRVKEDGPWSLMCPHVCPGLTSVFGEEFDRLYEGYEAEGRFLRRLPAREVWRCILENQIETGTPYMLYKDAINRKSNQKHVGTIQCGNLCAEIVEFTGPGEIAVCNLASLGLPSFVSGGTFDFEELVRVTRVVVRNLNRVIDINFYPVPEARHSNMRHRPIGVGVQGLADVFALMRIPFDSDRAEELNAQIFESIYYAAVTESIALADLHGAHETFAGSPASQGILQFDLWGVTPSRYDWDAVKRDAARGMRNSLLVAPMPTASTSQILGFQECFEPYTSNVYRRSTLAGEFVVVNEHLVSELCSLGLWSPDMRDAIIQANGSVQDISVIPVPVRELFKTVWEIKAKRILNMAVGRSPFICQSHSLNAHMEDPDTTKLTSYHFYGWERGLKTGMYYLRSRPKSSPQQFTIEPARRVAPVCTDEVCTDEVCTLCSA